jgi:hypothetical protein
MLRILMAMLQSRTTYTAPIVTPAKSDENQLEAA